MNKHAFHPTILREYDIRGVIGDTLFEEDAYWIGRCFGHIIKQSNGSAIAVGRDGRLSSPSLETNLVQGLVESGLDVYCLGIVPTPLLYFAEYTLPVDAAIMVTGSHNPPSHNGFKMSLNRKPFFGNDIEKFSNLLSGELSSGKGNVFQSDLQESYIKRLLEDLTFGKDLTVAWDIGNGATGDVVKALVQHIPGNHLLLNVDIDGTFPSHPPDPSDPENLIQLEKCIKDHQCDLGIAFDGDGDRLAAVDSEGHILWGDQLLLLFATDLLKRKPGATIISDVKASQGIFNEITHHGGNAVMWKTGHSYVKSKMAELSADLAGEMSGHFFFKEGYFGFDDGIYAGLRLIHLLSHSEESLLDFYKKLPDLPSTPEIRIPCPSDRKFKIPHEIKSNIQKSGLSFVDIDGIRVHHENGWWLLRASHTQDVLVARCEAISTEYLEYVKEHLKQSLEQVDFHYKY